MLPQDMTEQILREALDEAGSLQERWSQLHANDNEKTHSHHTATLDSTGAGTTHRAQSAIRSSAFLPSPGRRDTWDSAGCEYGQTAGRRNLDSWGCRPTDED